MRKTYSKPEIVFEDFSVTANIASGCEKFANAAYGSCGVEFIPGVMNIFLEGIDGCTLVIQDGSDEHNKLCYYNPSPSNNVFTS